MPNIGQIRGMLLEEALLHLLRGSGYRTVEAANDDETLQAGGAELFVKGRGSNHQVDAIADFMVSQPFSNPQRLLVEAKCYSDKVRLPVLRNAVGVLTDVSQYWAPTQGDVPAKRRYHYQYALFSASGYTRNAEKYAFAHDIFLIPLANAGFLSPILDAIRDVSEPDFDAGPDQNIAIRMRSLRQAVRYRLKNVDYSRTFGIDDYPSASEKLDAFVRICRRINYGVIATLGGRFPVFLIPDTGINIDTLPESLEVRIYWDSDAWYLTDTENKKLFSFDLPPALFLLYAKGGVLSKKRTLDLKEETMFEFQAISTQGSEVKVITFCLDEEWLAHVRERLERRTLPEANGETDEEA
jgi:hypothetical protein